MAEREVWLRGPIDGVPPLLQPVAHSLQQCREELERLLGDEALRPSAEGEVPLGSIGSVESTPTSAVPPGLGPRLAGSLDGGKR